MFGLDKPQYRASVLFAIIFECVIIIILDLFKISVLDNKVLFVLCTLLFVILNMWYFTTPKRNDRILRKFENESLKSKILGSIITTVIVLSTFIVLIRLKLN